MLWNGSVSVSVLLDQMGSLMQAPTVTQDGVCMGEEENDYLADISLLVDTQLEKTNKTLDKSISIPVKYLS